MVEYDLAWYKTMFEIRTKERDSWREAADEIAAERDQWYKAYKEWCQVGTNARNTLAYTPEER